MNKVFLNGDQREQISDELAVIYNGEKESIKSSGCTSMYDYLLRDKRWYYRFLETVRIRDEFEHFNREKKKDIVQEIRDVIVENNVYIY